MGLVFFVNPLRRDNPPSFMTGGVAGSQVTLCGEWFFVFVNVLLWLAIICFMFGMQL